MPEMNVERVSWLGADAGPAVPERWPLASASHSRSAAGLSAACRSLAAC
jgi:hypothetical protein